MKEKMKGIVAGVLIGATIAGGAAIAANTTTLYNVMMNGNLEYPTVEIEDMVSIGQKVEPTQKLTDNYGNRYSRAITNRDYNNFKHEFLTNMK